MGGLNGVHPFSSADPSSGRRGSRLSRTFQGSFAPERLSTSSWKGEQEDAPGLPIPPEVFRHIDDLFIVFWVALCPAPPPGPLCLG